LDILLEFAMGVATFIPASEAREIILSHMPVMGTETRSLFDAYQMVLAHDIVATRDVPPYDCSGMDGFALKSNDTRHSTGSPVSLKIMGEIAAGETPSFSVQGQTTVRIMTGATIPDGSDAVLEQELVSISDGSILVASEVNSGRNIRRRGEDVHVGQTVLRKGTLLRAFHLGVLASQGIQKVEVFRSPSVAVLTTGNELVDVTDGTDHARRDSNSYALWGLIREARAKSVVMNRSRDDEKELTEKVSEGLQEDMLITTGGVSVGKYDLILKVLESIGVEIQFWKIRIKPGMPMAFGVHRDGQRRVPIFALPGNPVSAVVTFLEFVRPAIQAMRGQQPETPVVLYAKTESEIPKNDSKRHFLRGVMRNQKGELFVRTTGNQSSGVLTSLTEANCLIVLPEDAGTVMKGSTVEIRIL
jgi:molybdopterin molybdotransferase